MSQNKTASWITICAIAILFFAAQRGEAAEGRIPISGPTTIDKPGAYFLSQDIQNLDSNGNEMDAAITITADHVTLDLQSHTITVSGFHDGVADTGTDIEVRDGKIYSPGSGGRKGVLFDLPAGQFRAHGLTITGFSSGISAMAGLCPVTARLIATDNVVQGGSTFAGIYAECQEASRIEQNNIRDAFVGIWLENTSDTIVSGNVVSHDSDDGILLANGGDSNTVERNIVTANGGVGIHLYTSSANSIVNNNASRNTLSGISLDGAMCNFNQVSYNTTSYNYSDGILLTSNAAMNTLDWNQSSGNGGAGVHIFGDGNVYSNNRAKANSGGSYVDAGVGNDNVVILTTPVTETNH